MLLIYIFLFARASKILLAVFPEVTEKVYETLSVVYRNKYPHAEDTFLLEKRRKINVIKISYARAKFRKGLLTKRAYFFKLKCISIT
jgi:hypothetical protein